jgi:hypothetical protein
MSDGQVAITGIFLTIPGKAGLGLPQGRLQAAHQVDEDINCS